MTIFIECLYSFIGSFCFGIIFNIKGSKLLFAALGGALSQVSFMLLAFVFTSEITQYFFATIIIAFYAEIMARIKKAPATVFLVPSIIPLVPGGMMYYSMEYCISGQINEFFTLLLKTIGVAGSLAIGILVVSSFNKLLKVSSHRKLKLQKNKV